VQLNRVFGNASLIVLEIKKADACALDGPVCPPDARVGWSRRLWWGFKPIELGILPWNPN